MWKQVEKGEKRKREEKRGGEQRKKWEDENEHNPVTGRKCPWAEHCVCRARC